MTVEKKVVQANEGPWSRWFLRKTYAQESNCLRMERYYFQHDTAGNE